MSLAPRLFLAGIAVCISGLCPGLVTAASAQVPTATVMYACYIPSAGVVYRIKGEGLPTACHSAKHVEFSWNTEGPQGEKGDKGDKGEKGDPGEAGEDASVAANAGQSCQTGSFVAGFTAAGGIVCRDAQGQVVPPAPRPVEPPPTVPPSIWDGTYTISPAVSRSCTSSNSLALSYFNSVIGSVTGFTITRISEDQLRITPKLGGVSGATVSAELAKVLIVPLVENVPSSVNFDLAVTQDQYPVTGTATIKLAGSFTGTTSFTGTLEVVVQGTYEDTPIGDVSGRCTIGPRTFTASRTN